MNFDVLGDCPVVFERGCASWPALQKWNLDFFSSQFGACSVRVWRQTQRGEVKREKPKCVEGTETKRKARKARRLADARVC